MNSGPALHRAEVVICGAGIAGVAAAYHLSVRHGVSGVVLVDERPPLTLTSDKSTECYRNWWPGPGDAMVAAMNRSIDLLEDLARESGNVFRMNRRGYLYASADPARIPTFVAAANEAAALGAGSARVHARTSSDYRPASSEGYEDPTTGADVLIDPDLIRKHFPYLSESTVAVLHARRCGWFSGQQLGMYMLERAREKGVRLVEGRVERVEMDGGRVSSVRIAARTGAQAIATPRFVIAAGPFLPRVARMLGIELPVYAERHVKIAFSDTLGALPREAPLLIWTDPVRLSWSEEEREEFALSPSHRYLLDEMPAGVHGRPEGAGESPIVLALWNYDLSPVEPTFPIETDPTYPEIVIRGWAAMIPALSRYLSRLPKCFVDGGYYMKTQENRFLAGPLPVDGAYVIGALSGYGLMASNIAGELVADYISDRSLPPYAPAFRLDRYEDPAYRELVRNWSDSGQL